MGLLLVEVVVSNQWLIYRSLPVVELVEEKLRSWSTRPPDRSISAITTTWLSKPGSRQLGAVRAWVRSTKCSSFATSPSVGCNFLPASNLSLFSPSLCSSPSFALSPPPCPPASSKSKLEKRQTYLEIWYDSTKVFKIQSGWSFSRNPSYPRLSCPWGKYQVLQKSILIWS